MEGGLKEEVGKDGEKLIEEKMLDCFFVHMFEELQPLLPQGFT